MNKQHSAVLHSLSYFNFFHTTFLVMKNLEFASFTDISLARFLFFQCYGDSVPWLTLNPKELQRSRGWHV